MRDLKRLRIGIGVTAVCAMLVMVAPVSAKSKWHGSKGKQTTTEATAENTEFANTVERKTQVTYEKEFDASSQYKVLEKLIVNDGSVFDDAALQNSANEYLKNGYVVLDLDTAAKEFNFGIGIKGRYFNRGFVAIDKVNGTYVYVVKCEKEVFYAGRDYLATKRADVWNVLDDNHFVSFESAGIPYDDISFDPATELVTYKQVTHK
ncbi:MAG: hypothetical protein IKS48_02995 [Eubacterium sp.]|nr:hypothetical protein [Eubacterium sp.]